MTFALIPGRISQTRSQLLSHVTFVLSWRAEKGARCARAKIVRRLPLELALALFPQGKPRANGSFAQPNQEHQTSARRQRLAGSLYIARNVPKLRPTKQHGSTAAN